MWDWFKMRGAPPPTQTTIERKAGEPVNIHIVNRMDPERYIGPVAMMLIAVGLIAIAVNSTLPPRERCEQSPVVIKYFPAPEVKAPVAGWSWPLMERLERIGAEPERPAEVRVRVEQISEPQAEEPEPEPRRRRHYHRHWHRRRW